MSKNFLPTIFLLAATVIVVPIILYIFQFAYWHKTTFLVNFNLSEKQEQWAQFGDFMNIWVSIASLFLLSGIAVGIHLNEEKSNVESKKIDAIKNRPLLVLKAFQENGGMKIRNIGNGPAINVFFTCSIFPEDEIYQNNLTRLDPIGIGEEVSLERNLHNNIVLISYNDIFGNIISSTYERSEIQIEVGVDVLAHLIKFDAQSLISFNTGLDLDF